MKFKKIIILLSGLLPIVFVQAQSLDELIQIGVEQNLDLKILKSEYQAALEIAPQVSELPDPEVGVGLFPFPVETRVGAQVARVSAMQKIPWYGLLDSKADLANTKAQTIYERIEARALNIAYEIKKAYYQLYEIDNSQTIISRNIELLSALENLALAKVESGQATGAEVLRVQLKTNELEQKIDILENKKRYPQSKINELLQRPLNTPIETKTVLNFATLAYNRDTLLAAITEQHPVLKMFALQQEVARKALAVNVLSAKPSFGVGADYIVVNERNDASPERNGRDILQLKATVKIPLNRQKYAAKEREENLKIAALDLKKENLLQNFQARIEEAYIQHKNARLWIDLYEQQIEITQAAISILERNYSVQGSGFDELLRLEKELIDYDLKKLNAIVQSHLAKASIEKFLK